MDENEVLENELIEDNEEESTDDLSEFNSDSSAVENNVSDEQIIDAIRSLIDENNIDGDSLPDESDVQADSLPTSEDIETIDYTELLSDIKYQLIEVNSHLSTLEEEQTATIFDKTLNEYNILDSLMVIIVVFFLCKVVIEFIKHFTPKIWK